MKRRTTIELDEQLLARAKKALGLTTTRETVEEALRLAAEDAEDRRAQVGEAQARYFAALPNRADLDVLAADDMWR